MAKVKQYVARAIRKMRKKHPLHRYHIEPIFIVGSGRSGNTLLRRILFNSPHIYIPPETYELGPSIIAFERHAHLQWETLCRIVLSYFAFSEDFKAFPTLYLRPLFQHLVGVPEIYRSYDYIVDQFYLFMAKQVKPETVMWGDKTPLNVFYLDYINRAFPNGKYIHIIRDGYDVISSYIEMGRYRTVSEAAARWVDAVSRCEDFGSRYPDKYISIRYENLVGQPAETVSDICRFLRIRYCAQLIAPPQGYKRARRS